MSLARCFFYAIFSGILLAASWPPHGFPVLLLIAFVPLLLFEQGFYERFKTGGKFKFFLISLCGFMVWNSLTTWWIWNSSPEGVIVAIMTNSILMAFTFFLFHVVKRRTGERIGNFVFIVFWISFEYFHHRWDLTWPWLTLGNAFAGTPWLIQWYEFTGTLGGSLWVLLVNVLVLRLRKFYFPRMATGLLIPELKRAWLYLIPVLVIPPACSLVLSIHTPVKQQKDHIVVVQPNFDPYTVKFNFDAGDQMKIFLEMAETKVKPGTKLLILPETAVSDGIYEDRYADSWCIEELRKYAQSHPGLKIITGASTWKVFKNWETPSASARQYGKGWYDAYNSALFIDSTGVVAEYHKSKLVPGVEKMPYPEVFGFLKEYAVDLGGISGTLASQDDREVFKTEENGIIAAPVICYESVFGEYVGGYIRNGANAIFVLTNDGWWGDTPGYRQHLIYGALRAIEYRVPVVRCTNTGISCFIDKWGKVSTQSLWWKQETIEESITPGSGLTFYAKYGDYLGNVAVVLAPLMIVLAFFVRSGKTNP